ncbi:4-(cytidine 5'-diphospho)-2-C-methyl-D-erythritol kinase [Colwellia sp. 1_MG-2023]|uniref:4-(cytidine 5'-diphospho)-2-C-methyl-D-erythritol kinase n=1 Tax=Colwellia sp. 1_MG-2023 TaxID=3062649 RepID=UPI0026E35BF7|nr:4-(cytidine 5'-diphospho)-2-C-methyl-D-erythritol kinase [Colwellia sp. 1_MG-2023]MDO6446449.1 4-(cytidine 5'-diphospho)-2-C-methyl-D-erythritol kinase [Colwellia sp. 1_MG-2023]
MEAITMPVSLPTTDSPFYQFPSPAKLNLFLHIVGRRADGYHELETVFQFLTLGDSISIKRTITPSITLLTPIDGVHNDDNLIVKAAKLLQEKAPSPFGAEIKITKLLPMGGGLGGGSSNAATVLLALNLLWQCKLTFQQLAELGLQLGADVPIFIHGFAAFAQGIGEKLSPVYPEESFYLISKPNCSISTQQVFTAKDLTRNTPKLDSKAFDNKTYTEGYYNDCQNLVINHYPEVAKLLAWLIEYAPSRMTGTGACIFSRFSSEQEAKRVQKLLPNTVTSFVTKGINTSSLHSVLQQLESEICT